MKVTDKEYQEHHIFADLQRLQKFYGQLSMSVLSFPSMGAKSIFSMDTYVYSSMQGTLESIELTLKAGRINDAYALLRKFHDSVIINVYAALYLRANFSIENFIVEKIHNWQQGKDKLPEFGELSKYIKASDDVRPISDVLHRDDRYKKIRGRCNDNMHYNFYKHVILNDNRIHLESRGKWLIKLSEDLRDLAILHLSYIFFINGNYMMSSDYMDAIDCGMEPEEGSQHWVAPFVQEFFDEVVSPHRPDITAVLKAHSTMCLT